MSETQEFPHRIVLVFRARAAEQLHELRRAAGGVSNAQLISTAISLYDWFTLQLARGKTIHKFNAEESWQVELDLDPTGSQIKRSASSDGDESVMLDMSEQAHRLLEELRLRVGAPNITLLVRDGLRLLEYYLEQARGGYQVGASEDGGVNVQVPELTGVLNAAA